MQSLLMDVAEHWYVYPHIMSVQSLYIYALVVLGKGSRELSVVNVLCLKLCQSHLPK